jgi:hypothetical protein
MKRSYWGFLPFKRYVFAGARVVRDA